MKEKWGYCHRCGWKKPSTKYRKLDGKRVRLCDSCADDLKDTDTLPGLTVTPPRPEQREMWEGEK